MRLGISSYTYVWAVGVPGYPQPARPLVPAGLVLQASELGVRVVQIADNLPLHRLPAAEIDALAALACQRQVRLELGTAGCEPDHLRQYVQLAVRLNSPIVRTVIDTESAHPSPEEAIEMLRKALPMFASAGVCLALENHDRFPARVLAHIVQQCDSSHLGICLDTANSLGCGEDLHTVVAALSRWVVNVHIKEFRATRLPHRKGFLIEGCPAGQGLLDIPRLLADLRDLRRDPNVILELWPPPEATIEESIAKEEKWARESVQFLRQFISE